MFITLCKWFINISQFICTHLDSHYTFATNIHQRLQLLKKWFIKFFTVTVR